jgi:hypothetical protein
MEFLIQGNPLSLASGIPNHALGFDLLPLGGRIPAFSMDIHLHITRAMRAVFISSRAQATFLS